jgi:hypothetical protein
MKMIILKSEKLTDGAFDDVLHEANSALSILRMEARRLDFQEDGKRYLSISNRQQDQVLLFVIKQYR